VSCGTTYRRAAGATITAETPGKPLQTRHAADWMAAVRQPREPFPWPAPEGASLRVAGRIRPVRDRSGVLLGWKQEFEPAIRGVIRLDPERLTFQPRGGREPTPLPLLDITAVHASSSELLIKISAEPVRSIGFDAGSLRFWEIAIQTRMRDLYHEHGIGSIRQFQPHVCTW
jgi:hypothetical protein